jgi:hypothetical protein
MLKKLGLAQTAVAAGVALQRVEISPSCALLRLAVPLFTGAECGAPAAL